MTRRGPPPALTTPSRCSLSAFLSSMEEAAGAAGLRTYSFTAGSGRRSSGRSMSFHDDRLGHARLLFLAFGRGGRGGGGSRGSRRGGLRGELLGDAVELLLPLV